VSNGKTDYGKSNSFLAFQVGDDFVDFYRFLLRDKNEKKMREIKMREMRK